MSTKFRFTPDHVLFGKLRPNLTKISRPDFSGICSTDILPIRPKTSLDRNYLARYLGLPRMVEFAASRTSGANLPRLSPTVLATFPIRLPSLHEQGRIAAVLDHADALRAKRRQVLAHLDYLTQSIVQELFGADDWIHEFGSVIDSGPSNGMYRPASDYGDGVPILRIDGFKAGDLLRSGSTWKRLRADAAEPRPYELKRGDVVINRVNALSHLGKAALIADIDQAAVYESNMMRIRVDAAKVDGLFVLAWLQTRATKQQTLRKAKRLFPVEGVAGAGVAVPG